MKACIMIRDLPPYRRSSFVSGLKSLGYAVDDTVRPGPDNILVIWNRYGSYDRIAKEYERAGGTVLVAENGYLGRDWRDGHWYAISKSFHNGGGWWPKGSEKRWDGWNVSMSEWRASGDDILVLATRHIGPQGVREPEQWAEKTAAQLSRLTKRRIRIRQHPGERKPETTLADDLANVWACVTWGSGAALKALLMGVPVFYGFPNWVGKDAACALSASTDIECRSIISRLPTFRSLAWAMWNTEEIASGEPFKCLLQ